MLGGGALGLTIALRLLQRGDGVVVFEREAVPGGLAAGFALADAHVEKFYHHLFQTDHDAIRLIEELGLGDRLVWRRPSTTVLRDGRLWEMDSTLAVLRFAALPLTNRLRLAAVTAGLKLRTRYRSFETETASRWLTRWMGLEVYETLWEPLLQSKFGDLRSEIAMPWFWARIHYRTASLGYLAGGFQQLYDSLMHRIVAFGGEVRLESNVRQVLVEGKYLRVTTVDSGEVFDSVVSTLPLRITAELVNGLPEYYRNRFGAVQAYSAMCLVLALSRRLTESYWINLNDPGFPFQPLVEHTNFMSPADYGGWHLVYLGNYLPAGSGLLDKSKEQAVEAFAPSLRRLNPDFDVSWIHEAWLFKAPFAQPVVTRSYGANLPPHITPVPGLYLANMFQIYPQDRGQNYSIRMAERLVRDVL